MREDFRDQAIPLEKGGGKDNPDRSQLEFG
jgi:hypothetical protein